MKLKFILIASFILAIMAMGAVSATDTLSEGIIYSENSLGIEETNLYTSDDTGSFSDLQNDINSSGNVLEISRNYKFDSQIDNGRILINKDNFVINGNGHTIDASGQSSIFLINSFNVTINNLTFINANASRGSVFYINENSLLTTNNVILENNTADIGTIFVLGQYSSFNDKIIDSMSERYGVITLYQNANMFMDNAFMMSSYQLDWGFIYSMGNSQIYVFNSTFANTTSKYSTAIRGNKITEIKNSKFINLHANFTAGAVALKTVQEGVIDNCTFINVTSEKNGGAIFIDGNVQNTFCPVNITNCNFINCYSGFGGAILSLGSRLIVLDSDFINNSALYDGGAIYTSYTLLFVYDSIFDGNYLQYEGIYRGTYGGTIFVDMGGFNMEDCEIKNSYAQTGGAVYTYDANYDVEGNTFSNNRNFSGDYSDLFTVFDFDDTFLEDNTFSGDGSCSLNNTLYETVFADTGRELILLNNTIDVSNPPSRFDLWDWEWLTPVRDQGRMGSCWAFGTTAAIESTILRYLGDEMDISENNMQDVSLQYFRYGKQGRMEGGDINTGASYALSWFGVFSSEYDSYDELGKISPIIGAVDTIHFQDVVFIRPRNNVTDNDYIKEAVLKYGALSVAYHAAQMPPFYNPNTFAQYCNNPSMPKNHVVAIVGWNDDYPAENFLITPPGDGAWIIKNSWGKQNGDAGYFYISYYDETIAFGHNLLAFILENTVEYNKNYQYDLGGDLTFLDSNDYVNFYSAAEDDFIAGVGTYFDEKDANYRVEIYVNEELKHTQNGVSPFEGFHTIQLDTFIPIEKGDTFAVRITSNKVPAIVYSRQHYIRGSSQFWNGTWINASDLGMTCCIKVYTVDKFEPQQNSTMMATYYDKNDMLVATLTDDEGNVITGAIVAIDIDEMHFTVKTNSAGQAKLSTKGINPGNYTAIVSYNGNSEYGPSNATVDFTAGKIETNLSAVFDSPAGELVVSLINAYTGEPLKGANVIVNINGETYTVRINSKGEGRLSLEGFDYGTYTTTLTYKGNAEYVPNTVKVKVVVKDEVNLSAVCDNNGDLVITLVDAITGDPLKGANVIVNILDENHTVKINSNGEGRLSIADYDYGSYVATFLYKGNFKYNPSTFKMDIENKGDVNLTAEYDGNNDEFIVGLFDAVTGAPLRAANVKVNIDGKTYTVKINSKGEGRLALPDLDYGTYVATFEYKGNAIYDSARITLDVIVKDNVNLSAFYLSSSKELAVNLVDAVTGDALKGANVIVNIGGNTYTVKIANSGQGRTAVDDLDYGIYEATLVYKGNSKYDSANVTEKIAIKDMPGISCEYDSSNEELIVTLVDEFTGAPLKGANVVVNIDGNNYNVKITSTGQGRLSLAELAPGSYTVTASYKGNTKYNAVSTTDVINI